MPWIVLHDLAEQCIGDRRTAHRGAGMAALGFFYGVDGEQPQCINGQSVERGINKAGGHNQLGKPILSKNTVCAQETVQSASILTFTLYPSQASCSGSVSY